MNERLNGIDLSSIQKAKDAVRHNAEQDLTWKHHEIASQLYGWTDRFRDRFLDPIARVDRQGKLPGPVIGFEKTDHRILAYYHVGHNAHGLEDEIILNEVHLDAPLYSILETVLHEQLHLWQQRFGEHPVKQNYHNKELCEKAESLGLHVFPIFGFHWKMADGPFEALMREYGIPKPQEVYESVPKGEKRNYWEGERKEGRSTLQKYECPECGIKVRVGVKKEVVIYCAGRKDKTHEQVLFVRANGHEEPPEETTHDPNNPFSSLGTLDEAPEEGK